MRYVRALPVAVVLVAAMPTAAPAQPQPGSTIGRVSTRDKLIVLEIDSGVIAPEHLFDLDHRTLRFTPDGAGYRIENVPVVWDAAFGDAAPNGPVALRAVRFPFSGRQWDTLSVQTGTITFGAPVGGAAGGAGGGQGGRRG